MLQISPTTATKASAGSRAGAGVKVFVSFSSYTCATYVFKA